MSGRRAVLLALLVVAFAAALRVRHAYGRESLWRDEAQDLAIVSESESVSQLLDKVTIEGHAPLHYLIEYAVQQRFGNATATMRTVPVIFGVLAVVALIALAWRAFGPACGLLSGLLMAHCPFFIYYSGEIRCYALFCLVSIANAAAFLALLRRPSYARAALWGATATLLMYVHYYAFYLVVPAGLYALSRDPSGRGRLRMCVAGAVSIALFAPWLPRFAFQLSRDTAPWYAVQPYMHLAFASLLLPLGKLGLPIALWGVARGFRATRDDSTAFRGLFWIGFGGTVLALIGQLAGIPFVDRYMIGFAALLLPCICVHWARMLTGDAAPFLGRYNARRAGIYLLVVALGTQLADPERWLFRKVSGAASIAARIDNHARPGDWIWISPVFASPAFEYHYRGDLPRVAPPYRGPVTHVDWIDMTDRERDADLIAGFVDDLRAHLDAGGRVWLVADGYAPVKREWAFSTDRGKLHYAPLHHLELPIHRAVMRCLWENARDVFWWDTGRTDYYEPLTLILFDPADGPLPQPD